VFARVVKGPLCVDSIQFLEAALTSSAGNLLRHNVIRTYLSRKVDSYDKQSPRRRLRPDRTALRRTTQARVVSARIFWAGLLMEI
jgi:hypothetical protein